MALSIKVGSFAQPTTTNASFAVTGVGFQPKIVIFFGNQKAADGSVANSNSFFGVATGASSGRVTCGEYEDNSATSASANSNANVDHIKCLKFDNTLQVTGHVVSLDADGFTINFDTMADSTQRITNYIALAGSDLTNVAHGARQLPASTGNDAVTGVGFKPDCLILFMHQATTTDPQRSAGNISACLGFAVSSSQRGYTGTREKNGVATDVSRHKQLSSKIFGLLNDASVQDEGDLVSMDSDGFTINWSTASNHFYYWIALKGGQYKVGTFTQKTSTGSQATTGIGFQPTGLILTSANDVSSATQNANGRFSLGAGSSSSARGCIWRGSTDGAVLSVASQNLDRANIIKMMTEAGASPTTQAAADLTSLDSDGWTLNWGSADATAREIIYLAMGSNAVVASTFLPRLNLLRVG